MDAIHSIDFSPFEGLLAVGGSDSTDEGVYIRVKLTRSGKSISTRSFCLLAFREETRNRKVTLAFHSKFLHCFIHFAGILAWQPLISISFISKLRAFKIKTISGKFESKYFLEN